MDRTLQKVVTKNTGWQINVMAENWGRANHAMLVETLDQTFWFNKIDQFDAILGLKEELYKTRAKKRWLIIKNMAEKLGLVKHRADACTLEDKFRLIYTNNCAFTFFNYIRFLHHIR